MDASDFTVALTIRDLAPTILTSQSLTIIEDLYARLTTECRLFFIIYAFAVSYKITHKKLATCHLSGHLSHDDQKLGAGNLNTAFTDYNRRLLWRKVD